MILGWLKFFVLLIVELPIQLVGLVINAITIPFRKEDMSNENDGHPRTYTQYPEHGTWKRLRLPKWALWWDNPYDGLLGDKRGWWANECRKKGRLETDFLSMYIWSALRNPANYFSRIVTGCDVSDCKITKVYGNVDVVDRDFLKDTKIWHLLVAENSKGAKYPKLRCLIPWSKKYCMEINIGWKVELYYNNISKDQIDQKKYIGNTLRIKFFVERKF